MESYIEIKQEIENLEKRLESKNSERNQLILPMFKIIEDNSLNNVMPSNLEKYAPRNLPLRLTILAEEIELNNLSNKVELLGEIRNVRNKIIDKNNEEIVEMQRLEAMRSRLEERKKYVLSRMPELDELDSQIDNLQAGINHRLNILNTVSLEPEEQRVIRDIIAKNIEQSKELNAKKDVILNEEGLYNDIVALKREMNPNQEEKIENTNEEVKIENTKREEFFKTAQDVNNSLDDIENELNEFQTRISKSNIEEKEPLKVRPVRVEKSTETKEPSPITKRLKVTPKTDKIEESKLKSTIRTNEEVKSVPKEETKPFFGFSPATDLNVTPNSDKESKSTTDFFKPAGDLNKETSAIDKSEVKKGVAYKYGFEEIEDKNTSSFFRPLGDLNANIEEKEVNSKKEKPISGLKSSSDLKEIINNAVNKEREELPNKKNGVYQKISDLPGVSKDLIGKWVIKQDDKYVDIDKIENPDPEQAILVLPNNAVIDYENGTYELPSDNELPEDYKENEFLNEELKIEESHSNFLLETKIKLKKKLRTILGLNTIIEKIREKKSNSKTNQELETKKSEKPIGESFYALLTSPDKKIIEEARKNIEDARILLEEHLEELTEEERQNISNNLSRIYLKLNQARNNKNHQRDDLYKQNIEELKIISDELANDINPQDRKVKTR